MPPKHADRKLPLKKIPKPRKRGMSPTANPPDYDADEFDFIKAIDKFKREKRKPFPTWSEVLAVLKELGWKKERMDDGG